MFINKQPVATPETLPDGEYTAQVVRLRMTKDESSVMFICKITSPGYDADNLEVVGYARANWNKPTGRTTANLYQWVKNLGGQLVDGQEDQFDLDTLKGQNCRVIVQSYIGKMDGQPRIKVSNILPFNKRPIPNPMAASTGMHVGGNTQQAAPQAAPQVTPAVQQPTQTVFQQPAAAPSTNAGSEDPNKLW